MEPIPDYLYHYTNLSSLGLILKNQNLKFNTLKNMDDLEEIKAKDLSEYGKYYYVSSWTDDKEEKLSLWNMYTRDMSGVRIKLHTLPFETYTYHIREGIVDIVSDDNFFPQEFYKNDKFVPIYYPNKSFVDRIEYTDDEALLCPQLISYNYDKNETSLDLNILGHYKRKEWYFQDEIRYKILFLPVKLNEMGDLNIIKRNIIEQKNMPFDSCFLKIKDKYFKEIEITKGHKMNEADSEILDLLVKNYCPTAFIKESKFKGKIR